MAAQLGVPAAKLLGAQNWISRRPEKTAMPVTSRGGLYDALFHDPQRTRGQQDTDAEAEEGVEAEEAYVARMTYGRAGGEMHEETESPPELPQKASSLPVRMAAPQYPVH